MHELKKMKAEYETKQKQIHAQHKNEIQNSLEKQRNEL